MYLLHTFETKLLATTYIECINFNKLFMYCSHKSVHVTNHINYTVLKNCSANITNSKQLKCYFMFHLVVVYVDTYKY